MSPAQLAIVCFRYVVSGRSETALDGLNEDIAQALNAEGFAYLSTTVLQGRTVLRLCTINTCTTEQDVRSALERLAAHGRRFSAQWSGRP